MTTKEKEMKNETLIELEQMKNALEKMGHDKTLEAEDLKRIHAAYFAVAKCVWRWNKVDQSSPAGRREAMTTKEREMKNTDTCGVRWVEFNKKEQAVKKERFFKSAEAREAFVKKVQEVILPLLPQ